MSEERKHERKEGLRFPRGDGKQVVWRMKMVGNSIQEGL